MSRKKAVLPVRIDAMGDFELVEHTADVGMRVRAPTLASAIERATVGLAEIAGTWRPGPGDELEVEVEASDAGALVVDWLNEVIYLLETRSAALSAVAVHYASFERASGGVWLAPLGGSDMEGTHVKAATLHGLDVRPVAEGWVATVYLDI